MDLLLWGEGRLPCRNALEGQFRYDVLAVDLPFQTRDIYHVALNYEHSLRLVALLKALLVAEVAWGLKAVQDEQVHCWAHHRLIFPSHLILEEILHHVELLVYQFQLVYQYLAYHLLILYFER